MMDTFSFVKNCLLTYNYPLAHSMNEEELADVFQNSNRCFLISWMLKLLDSEYEEVLQNSENDKEFLGNIIYELGFCNRKDRLPFMSGELPVTQQIKIISNIFTFISDIKKYNPKENTATVSNDDLIALSNTDLNLFPMYGEIKLLKPSEREQKLSELEREVDDITIDQKEDNTEANNICILDNKFKEDVQELTDMLRKGFPKVKSTMERDNKNACLETHNDFEFKLDMVEPLRECCKNLNIISQFIKNINTIEDFEKQVFELEEENRSSDTHEMIKALHQEVLSALKYSKCK